MKKISTCLFTILFFLSLKIYGQCPGQAIIISPTSDRTVCSNDSVVFLAGGGTGYTYSWLRNKVPIGVSAIYFRMDNIDIVPGSYRVVVTNGSGCRDTSAAIVVTVNTSPNISIQRNAGVICKGTGYQMTALVTGSGPFSYNWTSIIGNGPSSTTTDISVTADKDYRYQFTATDVNNNCVSKEIVDINPANNIRISSGEDISICSGSSAQLWAYNENTVSVSWSPTTGLDAPNSFQPIASPATTTTYTVTAMDYLNCFSKDTITIIVTPDPKVNIRKRWGVDTLCKELRPWDSVFLQASIVGPYKWFRNGVQVAETFGNFYPAEKSGSYTAEYTGGLCTTAQSSDLYIIPGCENYGQVSGIVFSDENSNGIREDGEKGFPGILMRSGQHYGITDSSGHYLLYVPSGYNLIDVILPKYSSKTFPSNPGTYTIDIPAHGTSFFVGKNFGVMKTTHVKDLSVSVTPGFARPGFDQTTSIYMTNNGTDTLDAVLTLNYDQGLTYLSSNPAGTNNTSNHTVSFNVGKIAPNQWLNYEVVFNIPVPTPLSSFLNFIASGTITGTDFYVEDNRDTAFIMVRGSYDPNDKAVYPAGVGSANYIHSNDEMEYTIRFQNTGNASAITVAVKDTIDTDLDLSTFKMLGKSHACKISIDSSRVITWTFNNIDLPDSTSDEKGSHGFIKYSLNQNSGNTAGTVIKNLAYIYFDFNPPVITNEVSNTVDNNYFTTGTTNSIDVDINQIKVYPNPAKEQVMISSLNSLNYKIIDMTGKQLLSGQTNTIVNTSILQKGLYILKLESTEGVYMQKLVIE
jgi:uncharacterized repeat protein (TIGR01451 family)